MGTVENLQCGAIYQRRDKLITARLSLTVSRSMQYYMIVSVKKSALSLPGNFEFSMSKSQIHSERGI